MDGMVEELSERKLKIGLIAPFSGANLGDAAIHEAARHGFGQHEKSEFLAICHNPGGVSKIHGIPAVSISAEKPPPLPDGGDKQTILAPVLDRIKLMLLELKHYRKVIRSSRTLDLIVFSGGGQFDDYWGGPWAHPYSMLVWAIGGFVTGTPVVIASVGIEQLSPLSRRFLALTSRIAKHISFRDEGSLFLARSWGIVDERAGVAPDLAIGLAARQNAEPRESLQRPMVIGICPISHKSWVANHKHLYANYLEGLVDTAAKLASDGMKVHIFVSQLDMDGPLVERMIEGIKQKIGVEADSVVVSKETRTLSDLCRNLKECDIVVASRLHAVLLSFVMCRPVVAISHLRKVTQLMGDIGQERYCIDIDATNAAIILDRITEIRSDYAATSSSVDLKIDGYQEQLADQYFRMLQIAKHR